MFGRTRRDVKERGASGWQGGAVSKMDEINMSSKLIPTILCGGAGSRLWPVSRETHPKPFIRLADNQSLLQKAFLRGAALPDVPEVLVVTNRELFFKTEDEFSELGKPAVGISYILEPFGRNTAAAVDSAALRRSEERRVGKECVSKCRSRWSP